MIILTGFKKNRWDIWRRPDGQDDVLMHVQDAHRGEERILHFLDEAELPGLDVDDEDPAAVAALCVHHDEAAQLGERTGREAAEQALERLPLCVLHLGNQDYGLRVRYGQVQLHQSVAAGVRTHEDASLADVALQPDQVVAGRGDAGTLKSETFIKYEICNHHTDFITCYGDVVCFANDAELVVGTEAKENLIKIFKLYIHLVDGKVNSQQAFRRDKCVWVRAS